MNALVPAVLEGEVFAPGDVVRVVGRTHPLAGGRVDYQVGAGLSIAEILAQCAGGSYGGGFVVYLGEHVIAPENFGRIRVKAGATLTFWPRLGDNSWKTVLSLVVAVTALIVAPYLAPGLITAFAAVGVSIAASTATALIAGGIMLASSLALNALFPVRQAGQPDSVDSTALISIQGARNQANMFGAVPVVLGRHRQSPFYAAKPYTETIGDDQYIRLLFCLGYGPLLIEDLRIGETPLGSFSYFEAEILQGFLADADPTLYPARVDEQPLAITMIGSDAGPAPWYVRTTAPDADEISVDFTAPEGCYRLNQSNGKIQDYSISINVEYAPAGSGAWSSLGDIVFRRSTRPARLGVRRVVTRGQYDVRVRKAQQENGEEAVKDTVAWTALRSFTNESPLTFPKPLALVALRIKGSDQLSGVIDTLNCVTTSLVKAYSGSGSVWNDNTASQNPADLFRWVLQGPANARPVADALIDIAGLQGWWTYCVANGFKFNQVVGAVGSVYDKLSDIAAAGRAVPTFTNGQWSVVWDRPADSIVQHFTPRNSWGLQLQRAYAQQPHGWRVSFINEENGFTQDERIVYDDGYNAGNATLFEGMQFPGVTDPGLVWKHGRFHIAQSRLRPEKITINVGWENLVCTRGDRVRVTHDVLLIGQASGRIKSVVGQVVTFDEVLTIVSSNTYGFQLRIPEDTRVLTRAVNMSGVVSGDYTQLTLVGDLSLVVAGTLFAFGLTSQASSDYRVQSIQHQKDLIATLTLVDDAPAISTADSGVIPAYAPNISIPPDPFTLGVQSFGYAEVIDGAGAGARAIVALSWQVPRFGKIASFEVQMRDDVAGGGLWARIGSVLPPDVAIAVPLVAAGTWSFRVRCLFLDGTASDWETLSNLVLQGLSRAPAPIADLRSTYISGRSFLSWTPPADVRDVPVEIRKGATFGSAQIVEDAAISPWQTVGDDIYFVSAYATSPFGDRVYAAPEQSIEIVGSVAIENVIVQHDERAEGWTGTFEGSIGIDNVNNFLRTAGDDDFLNRSNFLGTANFIDGDGTLQTGGVYWSPHVVNAGGVSFCRVANDWTATGAASDDNFLGQADFLGNPDFLSASRSQYVRVRPIIRVSQVGPVPVWGDVQVWSPDVYKGWMFQLGIQFEILTDIVPDPKTVAFLLSWVWSVDVPDRLDSYQNLTVPIGGLPITFRPTGGLTDLPFNGGLNDELLPHLTPSMRNPDAGDLVTWTSLTLSSVTLKVMNGGADVGGDEVNLLVRGY